MPSGRTPFFFAFNGWDDAELVLSIDTDPIDGDGIAKFQVAEVESGSFCSTLADTVFQGEVTPLPCDWRNCREQIAK
jgi:hypothetical protein